MPSDAQKGLGQVQGKCGSLAACALSGPWRRAAVRSPPARRGRARGAAGGRRQRAGWSALSARARSPTARGPRQRRDPLTPGTALVAQAAEAALAELGGARFAGGCAGAERVGAGPDGGDLLRVTCVSPSIALRPGQASRRPPPLNAPLVPGAGVAVLRAKRPFYALLICLRAALACAAPGPGSPALLASHPRAGCRLRAKHSSRTFRARAMLGPA